MGSGRIVHYVHDGLFAALTTGDGGPNTDSKGHRFRHPSDLGEVARSGASAPFSVYDLDLVIKRQIPRDNDGFFFGSGVIPDSIG